MNVALVTRIVAWWVRLYTRGLAVAERRREELAADVHDQVAHERADGRSDRRIALGVLSRMVRGIPADVLWRRRVRPRRAALIRLSVAALGAVVGVAALNYANADDAPGLGFIGLLLISGSVVMAVRTRPRR